MDWKVSKNKRKTLKILEKFDFYYIYFYILYIIIIYKITMIDNLYLDLLKPFDTWSLDFVEPVLHNIWEVSDKIRTNLDPYKWMEKIQIIVNWEKREIYIDNENLRVDSSKWNIIKINRYNVKVNPEWDIIEYIYWPEAWQQLFDNRNAAEREAKKLWKRLPFAHDNYMEFQAIIDKIGVSEFMKRFPGYGDFNFKDFINRGCNSYFWCAHTSWSISYYIWFGRWDSKYKRDSINRSYGLSVRLIKD